MQAVQVESVKANAVARHSLRVVAAQRFDEVDDRVVAPHPAREADEIVERGGCSGFFAGETHPPVHTVGVGPIGLHGDDVELLGANEGGREIGADSIKLFSAVSRLANEYEPRIA